MGNVPSLYTTGDNDPELQPTQRYRHFFYCDECGAFEIEPWVKAENHRRIEALRYRLGMAAAGSIVLVVAAGWLALGLPILGLSLGLLAIFGVALFLAMRATGPLTWIRLREASAHERSRLATLWSRVRALLPWILIAFAAELLALVAPWPYWISGFTGAVLVAGLLTWRAVLGSRIQVIGVRCRACGATYPRDSSFLADLDANPRGLTVADVPRPLGASYFRVGRSVEPGSPESRAPSPPPSRLPR